MSSDSDAQATWLQLRLYCDAGIAERLADTLTECGALSVSLDDAEHGPLYEPAPGETPLWPRTRVSGLFPGHEDPGRLEAELARRLAPGRLPQHDFERLPDCDWVSAHRNEFRAACFRGRLWVVPTWAEPPAPAAGEVQLTLDPGLAFGTGSHATTALCLEWLAGEPLAETTVIDYGCGSGILALAAARLGARRAWAVDHDPQAVEAAHRNAVANALHARIAVCLPADLPALTADVLVANILAKPLIDMAETLSRLLRPGGRMALAGVLSTQAPPVIAAFEPWCRLHAQAQRDDWVLLTGRRAGPGS